MTVLFVLLGLVVGGMLIGGILAFLPSKTLGDIERKINASRSGEGNSEK